MIIGYGPILNANYAAVFSIARNGHMKIPKSGGYTLRGYVSLRYFRGYAQNTKERKASS
jgi:hypothetical protein